jgi:acyl-CoA hydrolase/L-amino acid N-acyltransferase YncA
MPQRWELHYDQRRVGLDRALGAVQRGSKVFLGTACAEPQYLVQGLLDRADILSDVQLLHFVTLGNAPYADERFDNRFRHNAFFVGPNSRDAINQGRADYTPVFISEIPGLFRRGIVPLDVALIQTSPPDRHGFVSLGISVDIVKAAAETARVVIAQVNRGMPRTLGDSFLPVEKIDYFVEHDPPLVEFHYPEPDTTGRQIGRNAAKLINSGDTIHVGFGHLSYGVLRFLEDKRDLGVHTEVISDAFIDLIEQGVITGERKNVHRGKVVCSFCIGTRRIYDYVADNPRIAFYPAEYVYNPMNVARNERMVSIGSALEVDLSGQICSESMGSHFYSGIGGRLDFIRGAAMSPEGRSIITLPSVTRDGAKSRIRAQLQEGAGVAATRGDVKYVVTEYGIAYLHGKSVRERAMALINIAHPKFRKELLEEAKKRAYVYRDQLFLHTEGHAYPEEEEIEQVLSDGLTVTIRPIKPTDEPLLQDLFYSHSDENIYRRYFSPVKAMPRAKAQKLANVDYRQNMALVVAIGEIGLERIIGVGRYVALKEKEGMVEVAYTIHDAYQGRGLGSLLQERLERYAERMGFKGVTACVFEGNRAMFKTFSKRGAYQVSSADGGVLEISRGFSEPDPTG